MLLAKDDGQDLLGSQHQTSERLKTPNGTLATADGGITLKDPEGWMWDLIMWIINGVEADTGRVRQHWDLSYWMSDWEISTALNIGVEPDNGLWPANAEIESVVRARRGISSLRSNVDEKIGALYFVVEYRGDWQPLLPATWSDDKAESPSDPRAAARAHGRDSVWCAEGFNLNRPLMVEEFELSHRISEDEILTALGNPPGPYFGGLPPTEELHELISARINLDLRIEEVEYQINLNSRYGSHFQ